MVAVEIFLEKVVDFHVGNWYNMGVARETPRSLTSERFEDFNGIGYSGVCPCALHSSRIPETVPLDLEAETANGLGFA